MLPEDEKCERASVCIHILSLSLTHKHRLTSFELLLGVYSKQKKESQNIERTKKKQEKKTEGTPFSRCDEMKKTSRH
jgi:hypothetical protein